MMNDKKLNEESCLSRHNWFFNPAKIGLSVFSICFFMRFYTSEPTQTKLLDNRMRVVYAPVVMLMIVFIQHWQVTKFYTMKPIVPKQKKD